MTHKVEHRIVAVLVFLVSAVVYLLTMAPTVVFWDVGEFIAAAFMTAGAASAGVAAVSPAGTRVALMLPIAADLAVRAHAFTALSSAVGIMFLYLVIVRVIINFRGIPGSSFDKIIVYSAAAIGAFSLGFGTTYWNNSIESEVYGMSMFFLGAVMWLVTAVART